MRRCERERERAKTHSSLCFLQPILPDVCRERHKTHYRALCCSPVVWRDWSCRIALFRLAARRLRCEEFASGRGRLFLYHHDNWLVPYTQPYSMGFNRRPTFHMRYSSTYENNTTKDTTHPVPSSTTLKNLSPLRALLWNLRSNL